MSFEVLKFEIFGRELTVNARSASTTAPPGFCSRLLLFFFFFQLFALSYLGKKIADSRNTFFPIFAETFLFKKGKIAQKPEERELSLTNR